MILSFTSPYGFPLRSEGNQTREWHCEALELCRRCEQKEMLLSQRCRDVVHRSTDSFAQCGAKLLLLASHPMASYVRQSIQVGSAIDQVKAANPDAVIVVGPSNTVAPILKQAHQKGWHPLFVTVSFVGADELIQEAGSDADGMVITQVVPPYYLTDLKTVALYRRTMLKYAPESKPNLVSLEGFVDALVMVEGMKRAGKELTREGLIRGIESIHDWDAGLGPDLKVDYSAREHKGFHHVIPTVVRSGRIVPFTDWAIVPAK